MYGSNWDFVKLFLDPPCLSARKSFVSVDFRFFFLVGMVMVILDFPRKLNSLPPFSLDMPR